MRKTRRARKARKARRKPCKWRKELGGNLCGAEFWPRQRTHNRFCSNEKAPNWEATGTVGRVSTYGLGVPKSGSISRLEGCRVAELPRGRGNESASRERREAGCLAVAAARSSVAGAASNNNRPRRVRPIGRQRAQRSRRRSF